MTRTKTNLLLAGLTALLAWASGGCGPSDPNDPQYWIEKLKTKERKAAVRQLGGMGEKAHVAVPHLVKMYNQSKDRSEVVTTLAQLKVNTPEVIEIYVKAITDREHATAAAVAATTLGELGVKEKSKDLVAVLTSAMDDETKAAALRSLAKLKDPGTVNELIGIVQGDPDKQWIHLNALACEALGAIGSPHADPAVPAMLHALFLRDRYQRLAYKECALTLLKFPELAGQAVLNAMDGKDEALNELAKQRGLVDGLIPAEGVKVLALLRYKAAAPRVMKELVVKLIPPSGLDEKRQEWWRMIEAQRFQNSMDALARIGDDSIIPELSKWLYKDEYLRRVRVPVALATIGTPLAYKELLKAARTTVVDKDNTWFRIDCSQYLAYMATPEQVKDLEEQIKVLDKVAAEVEKVHKESPDAGAKDFLDRIEGFKLNVAALKECQSNRGCWEGKLKATHPHVREMAIWQLARLSKTDPAALDVLLANIANPDFEFRNAVLQVLPVICDQRCAPAIEKVLKDEEGKVAFKGFRDVMQFVLAQVQMRN